MFYAGIQKVEERKLGEITLLRTYKLQPLVCTGVLHRKEAHMVTHR